MEYCTNCGTSLAGAPRFCTRCGAPVRKVADPAPSAPEAPGFDHSVPDKAAPLAFEPPAYSPPHGFEPLPQGGPPPAPEPPPTAEAHLAAYSPPFDEQQRPGFSPRQPLHMELSPEEAQPWPVTPVPRPGRPPRSPSRFLALLAGAVILAAGGGAAWFFLGRHATRSASSPGASVPGTTQTGPGNGAGQSLQTSTSSPSPSQIPSASPGAVVIAPGVSQQPGAAAVASFVQAYFTAINHHDYAQYISLFQAQLRPTVSQFHSGYRGTSDSNVTLTEVSPTANGVAATVTFTSHQPAGNSPTSTACTNWDITLYLQARGSGYVIGPAPPGYHAHFAPC